MNWKRFRKMREMKAELGVVNGAIQDNITILSLINLVVFALIFSSISAVLIFELGILPILALLGIDVSLIYGINKYRKGIKSDMAELYRERNHIKSDIDSLKHNNPVRKAITDNEIRSFINIKDVNRVYNILREEKLSSDIKPLESENLHHTPNGKETCKVYLTGDMIDRIYQIFEEGNNVADKSQDEVNQMVITQINEVFSDNSEYKNAHKINLIEPGFVKKLGTR